MLYQKNGGQKLKNANENIDEIKEKLKYIGLDFDNIPEFFKQYKKVEFKSIRENEQRKHKVYKFIDVKDIQIYITPKNRMDTFLEKYRLAKKIASYMEPKDEEEIPLQANFFKMLKDVQIEQIEKIEKNQKQINNKIPFKVSYEDNFLWEIYYSQTYNQFFMLVPLEDSNYASLFYLIKKQIESFTKNKSSKIYVPVCYMEYTEKLLKKSELNDIENYMWLFTKQWPCIYEVYDKYEKISVQIVGDTYIFDNLKSYYKVSLKNKEEAVKFYKYIKALFILQSEISHKYKFVPKIDGYGMLKLYYNNKKITYDMLPAFIEEEYKKIAEQLKDIINKKYEYEKKLEETKKISKQKEIQYHQKEKEIALFLECKKSFFGKIRYFFKHKKIVKQLQTPSIEQNLNIEKVKVSIEQKEFYTIEDLVNLHKEFNKIDIEVKNLNLDIDALNLKIEMMERKIKNATEYINEIDKHNKSIFDFWKFTNKDENLALNESTLIEEERKGKLQKTFEYETDFEDFATKIDKIQRQNLTKQECDYIFLAQTDCLDLLNIIKKNELNDQKISKKDEQIVKNKLEDLKKEVQEQRKLFEGEEFDIFGGLLEDNTKIKHLNGKKHREIEKSKFEILNINKNTKTLEYINTLKQAIQSILDALEKSKVTENMPIYKLKTEVIDVNNFETFNINIQNIFKDEIEQKQYLYKVNLKEGTKAIYLSNIIYYDNNNNTLPLGMDIDDKVLLDLEQYELKLKNKDTIKINQEDGLYNIVKTISVFEYGM